MIAFVSNTHYLKVKNFEKNVLLLKSTNSPNLVFFSKKNKQARFSPIKMQKNEEESSGNKSTILDFFQEVKDEIKMIEWPALDRVLKQFVIVVISLVFSALFIFSIDGLFAAGNKILFEGNF
mmetsp:Transcript_21578/g.54454  ORF Transcript_21578/g.54454 Transcript_21578/m.54454 type:complete len:122 (+) Transcript_21578:763-1128(+)